jgi:hypothetical protein
MSFCHRARFQLQSLKEIGGAAKKQKKKLEKNHSETDSPSSPPLVV